jgi:hypothetical protein
MSNELNILVSAIYIIFLQSNLILNAEEKETCESPLVI